MIYIFSNDGYGDSFLKEAIGYFRGDPKRLQVIFSGKHRTNGNLMRRTIKEIRRYLENARRELEFHRRHGVRMSIVNNVNGKGFAAKISRGDIGIIAGFNQIFSESTISRFGSLVNFHPSLLPLYRGPVPSYWCLRHGETHSGFTLHTVTSRIDDGEILFQDVVEIDKMDTPELLNQRIADKARPVFGQYLASRIGGHNFIQRQVDPFKIYKTHHSYLSFPSTQ